MLSNPWLAFAFTLFITFASAVRAHPVTEMVATANAYLAALTPEQRTKTALAFATDERENWHFVPRPRQGLPLKQMSAEQQKLAHALLRSGLSQRGHTRVEAIAALEYVLQVIENNYVRRDPELYFVTIFGEPAEKSTWGWRVEGHHLSLNFTIVNGQLAAVSPSFFGANPAEVRTGPQQGRRALAEEEDLGRAFIVSLDEEHRRTAIIDEKAPSDILTMANKRADVGAPAGLSFEKMTPAQRDQLVGLVQLYIDRFHPEVADVVFAKIEKAGLEKVSFAWAGPIEKGAKHYYRIHGPTFLVEYDNTQNDGNHIHTVWRDFDGDFGRDLLQEHIARDHAK